MVTKPYTSVVQRRKSNTALSIGVAAILALIIGMGILFWTRGARSEEIILPTSTMEVKEATPSFPIPDRKPGPFVVIPIDKPTMLKYEPLVGEGGVYFA